MASTAKVEPQPLYQPLSTKKGRDVLGLSPVSNYMLNVLRLKQSAGILDRKALEDVNAWLETPPPAANPPVITPPAQ